VVCRSLKEYKEMYAKSVDTPEAFWREITDEFHWHK
jgi:hypothetical protein